MSEVEHGPITRHTRSLMELDAVVKALEDAVSGIQERLSFLEAWAQEHDSPASHVRLIGGLEGMGGD